MPKACLLSVIRYAYYFVNAKPTKHAEKTGYAYATASRASERVGAAVL
jgi:hypothetical protein